MPGNVLFQTDSEEDTDQFIREYVLDAIDRVSEIDGCNGITFDRDEQLNPDGDSVVLSVMGNFETFVDHERDRWNEYQETELVNTWEATSFTDEEVAWKFGENGADLATQLLPLGGEMAKRAYEEFEADPFPHPVDSTPQDDGWIPVGWWLVLHHITVGNLKFSRTPLSIIN